MINKFWILLALAIASTVTFMANKNLIRPEKIISDNVTNTVLPVMSPLTSPKSLLSPSDNSVSPKMSPSPRMSPVILSDMNTSLSLNHERTKIPLDTVSAKDLLVTHTPLVTVSLIPNNPDGVVMDQKEISVLRSVVINEIGWMGTKNSSADEWIELYNPQNAPIDLTHWMLESTTDASPTIILAGSIQGHAYYLIERTSEATIPGVAADLVASFGKGGLNNAGEKLVLKNAQGVLVDVVDGSNGWYNAGDNTTKASMERIWADQPGDVASNWKTNNNAVNIGQGASDFTLRATPKFMNSVSR